MRQSIGAGDRHRRLADPTRNSAGKTSPRTPSNWTSAGLPPRLKSQLVVADRRSTRRGIGTAALALTLLSAAAIGYHLRPEFTKPGLRSFSPINDAFAAGALLIQPPARVAAALVAPVHEAAVQATSAAATAAPKSDPIRSDLRPANNAGEGKALDDAAPSKPRQVEARLPDRLPDQPATAAPAPAVPSAPASPPPAAVASAAPAPAPSIGEAATVAPSTGPAVVAALQPPVAAPTNPVTTPVAAAALPAPAAASPVIGPKEALTRKCQRDIEIAATTLIIAFDVNSASISPLQAEQLKRFSGLLRLCPDVKIEVAGHTDMKGAKERNFGLSWERAEAVIPLSDNPDAATYNQIDRRVELTIR
jgi:outer membrane protein OmpA-like peptidoglycan-associated protein